MVDGRARPRGKAWESAADAVPYEEFDPLNRANLGRSVETALVSRPLVAFNALFPFWGSGIYAIYFTGPTDHSVYGRIAGSHSPIYVGRARPKGSRKGSAKADGGHRSKALSDRLYHHRTSIEQAVNLTVEDFSCRWLVADMLFVPMAEQLMIETYRPIWNGLIDGFGNNAPGGGRGEQVRSRWDTLHPGRYWAYELPDPPYTDVQLRSQVLAHFDQHPPESAPAVPPVLGVPLLDAFSVDDDDDNDVGNPQLF